MATRKLVPVATSHGQLHLNLKKNKKTFPIFKQPLETLLCNSSKHKQLKIRKTFPIFKQPLGALQSNSSKTTSKQNKNYLIFLLSYILVQTTTKMARPTNAASRSGIKSNVTKWINKIKEYENVSVDSDASVDN
jgi:hypothetical protein